MRRRTNCQVAAAKYPISPRADPCGEQHALHEVAAGTEAERTDFLDDEAGPDAGDQQHPGHRPADPSSIDQRQQRPAATTPVQTR
jgi:hypothetical protein